MVTLEIEDGDPWYMSPNVWAVPGDDPEGPIGTPVAGRTAYLWARVRNNGTDAATNATVRYYWANPSVGFDRNSATLVGASFVTLGSGQSADVLCLTPWTPSFVNGGHECILAEAFHSSDPLPSTPAFDVPTDRHVAQRNLSVLNTPPGAGAFHLPFEVHNAMRSAETFSVTARVAALHELGRVVPLLGKNAKLPHQRANVKGLGFVRTPCPTPSDYHDATDRVDRLRLEPRGRTGLTLVGTLDEGVSLIHVTQERDGRVVGGLAVLVVNGKREEGR